MGIYPEITNKFHKIKKIITESDQYCAIRQPEYPILRTVVYYLLCLKNTIDQPVYIWYYKWTGGEWHEN